MGSERTDFLSLEAEVCSPLESQEIRRLKTLEDENARLKRIVADLTLDKQMLQDVLSKKL